MKRITATINNEKPSKNPSTTNLPSSSASSSLSKNVIGLHYPKLSYVPPSKITLNRVSTVVSIPKTNYNQQNNKPSSLPKPTSTVSVPKSSTTTTNTEKKSGIVDTSKNVDHHHQPARVHFSKKIFHEDIRPVLKVNQQHQKSSIPRYPTSSTASNSQQLAQNRTIKKLQEDLEEIANHVNQTPPKIIRYKSKFHNIAEYNKNLELERERKAKEKRLSSKLYDPQEVKSFIENQRELHRLIKEREEEEKKQEQERIKRSVGILNRKCRTIVKNCNKKAIISSPTKPKTAQVQVVKQRPATSTTTGSSIEKYKVGVGADDLFTAATTTATNNELEHTKKLQFQSREKTQELQLLKDKSKSPTLCDNVNVDTSNLVAQFQKIVEKECMKILNNCKIIETTTAEKKRKPSSNSEHHEIEPNRKRLKEVLSPPKLNKISPQKVDLPMNTESFQHNGLELEYKKISKANSAFTLSPLKYIDNIFSSEIPPKSKPVHHSNYKGITNSNLVNEFQANVEKECMEILNNCNLNLFDDTSVSKTNLESKSKTKTSTAKKTESSKKSPNKFDNEFDLERANYKKLKDVLLSPPSKYHHNHNQHSPPIPHKFKSETDAFIKKLFPAKECENSQTKIKMKSAKSIPKLSVLKEKFENDDNDNNNNEPVTISVSKPIIRNEFHGNRNHQEQQILNHFTNENIEDSNKKRSITISKVALLKNAMLRNDTKFSTKIPTNIFAELKKCQKESMRATSSCAKLVSELKTRGYETEMIPERDDKDCNQVQLSNKEYSGDSNMNASIKSINSRLSHSSISSSSVSGISIDKELKEKDESLSESNFEAVSFSQHSIKDSIDEYSLDFESERICTETTRHSNSTSIFPLSNEMNNAKQEEHQQDKSINTSRIDEENFSTNENSRIESEIHEEEYASSASGSRSSDVKEKANLSKEKADSSKEKQNSIDSQSIASSNEVHNSLKSSHKTLEKSQLENLIVSTKLQLFDEESINEDLEITKNDSIAEEIEEYSQDFQSEHHFSTSNIPTIETLSKEVDEGKDLQEEKENFSSHDNSRIDTDTEANKGLSDAETFEEKAQKSYEIEDNQLEIESSSNFSEEESFKENSKLGSKAHEEIHTPEDNLLSNQNSQNIVSDQEQEKGELENSIKPSKLLEESIAEELEISKNESIPEEIEEYSEIFESEHHISTSNIPITLIESNKDNNDKNQEQEKSINNSIAEEENENFSTNDNSRIDSEVQEETEKSDLVVSKIEKDFLEIQQETIEVNNDQIHEHEKSQDNTLPPAKLQLFEQKSKDEDSITEKVEEYTQKFETEHQVTSPNKLLDDHELSLLIDENDQEWFEDDLSGADADKDVLKKEAVKILSERMKVENEIRALELSANSPTSTLSSPQPQPVINESIAIVPSSINRTSLSFSDGIIDKPPPPYQNFSISQSSSPESLSNSISLRSFMISCEESKVAELVAEHIDLIWDYWVKNKELPDKNEEEGEDERSMEVDGAEKMNLSNSSSNINYNEDRDKEKDEEDDDLVIQKSPANIATTALQSLLKDLINETTHEVLLVQTEYGKSFMDRIRVGPLTLQAQKFRIPKTKNELVSRVLQKVTEFIPELILEHELVAATTRKKKLTKWTSRPRDIVDQLLAEELVIEDREFNETWPEEAIIMEKLQEKIVRMIIQDVDNNFTQAYS